MNVLVYYNLQLPVQNVTEKKFHFPKS